MEDVRVVESAPCEKMVLFDQYRNQNVEVLFSSEDAIEITQRNWRISVDGYVVATEGNFLSMHAFVWNRMGLVVPEGYTIDHVFNRSPLDNRRSNLRVATRSQQAMNRGKVTGASSAYNGVSLMEHGTWRVQGYHNGEQYPFPPCDTEYEAAVMYDRWVLSLPDFGPDWAMKLNFKHLIEEHRLLGPPVKRVRKRKFTGVEEHESGKFSARYKDKHIGMFETAEDAAMARDRAVVLQTPVPKKKPDLNFPDAFPEYMELWRTRARFTLAKTENGVGYVWIEKFNRFVLLDTEDYERCKMHRLKVTQTKGLMCAMIYVGKSQITLGRFILNETDPKRDVICLNFDRLDARKSNLMSVTKSDMTKHRRRRGLKGFKGVQKHGKNWLGKVMLPKHLRVEGDRTRTKTFENEEHAARWRDIMVKHYEPVGCHVMNFDWTPEEKLYWIQELKLDLKE